MIWLYVLLYKCIKEQGLAASLITVIVMRINSILKSVTALNVIRKHL